MQGSAIDIWCVCLDEIDDRLLDAYRGRLPRDEVAAAGRFLVERLRRQYLVTRMLVRSVLSGYTGCDVGAWHFDKNEHGKPSVASPEIPLAFNLSHAGSLVACAVTAGCDVGIDVESFARTMDHRTLAGRFFAPAESAAIAQAPPQAQARLFLRYWTLKEAFLKARGTGLSLPLADVRFTLDGDAPPRVSFAARLKEQPEDWQFAEPALADGYQAAVAVRMPADTPAEIRIRRTIPLLT